MRKFFDEIRKDPWGWTLIVILAGVVLFGLSGMARSHDHKMHKGHEHHHDDFYSKWLTAEGFSCCNSKSRHVGGDCAPLEASRLRSTDEGYSVLIEGEWIKASKEKIRPYFAPDFTHHLCNIGKNIRCLVIGGGI